MVAVGAYFGNDPSALAAYEAWLGRRVDNVLFYLNQSSWSAFDSSIDWAVGLWRPSARPVIWSVPLVVEGASLDQAAAGAFDGHYRAAAVALAGSRTDSGPIYVRVGWEFNGSWMPWSAQGREGAFIGAFRDFVDVFRSVSDRFRFVWDVNLGGSYDPARAYPGDAYVDVVGMDFYYNRQWDSADPRAAFRSKVEQTYGLQWQQDFAAAHGKPTAISEWGVDSDGSGAYVAEAARWFSDHGTLFQNYWESDYANYDSALRNDSKPETGHAFRAAFGAAAAPAFGDLNGDGASDLVLQAGGTVTDWIMGAGRRQSGNVLGTDAAGYGVVGRGDLDGDRTADLVLQNGGTIVDWIVGDGRFRAANVLTADSGGFAVRAVGDVNGDGTADIILQNGGTVVDWIMSNGRYQTGNMLTTAATGYTVVGAGDFDGDGDADLLLQNGGTVVEWVMQAGLYQSGRILTTAAAGYAIVGTGDFNGDGTDDIVLQNGGTVVDWIMQNGAYQSGNVLTADTGGFAVRAVGDYNGDGTDDIALQAGTGTVVQWTLRKGVYASGTAVGDAAGFRVV